MKTKEIKKILNLLDLLEKRIEIISKKMNENSNRLDEIEKLILNRTQKN